MPTPIPFFIVTLTGCLVDIKDKDSRVQGLGDLSEMLKNYKELRNKHLNT